MEMGVEGDDRLALNILAVVRKMYQVAFRKRRRYLDESAALASGRQYPERLDKRKWPKSNSPCRGGPVTHTLAESLEDMPL